MFSFLNIQMETGGPPQSIVVGGSKRLAVDTPGKQASLQAQIDEKKASLSSLQAQIKAQEDMLFRKLGKTIGDAI